MTARGLRLPSVDQLSSEPQLAALAVLETAASIAVIALAAEHPELGGDDDIQRDHDELRTALDLIELARALGITIVRYRRAVAESRRDEQRRLPF